MALVLVQVVTGTWIFVNRDSSKTAVSGYLQKWIREYDTVDNARIVINTVQSKVSERPVLFLLKCEIFMGNHSNTRRHAYRN